MLLGPSIAGLSSRPNGASVPAAVAGRALTSRPVLIASILLSDLEPVASNLRTERHGTNARLKATDCVD
jgi:hypothetical protein